MGKEQTQAVLSNSAESSLVQAGLLPASPAGDVLSSSSNSVLAVYFNKYFSTSSSQP